MRFAPTLLPGVFEIDIERHADARGSFERIYCSAEFAEHGLELPASQSAISRNTRQATLRGLHVIPEAEGEAKLVRCIRGRVFDVAVDIRPGSPTHGRHIAAELSAERGNALFLPRGVAHGFITLENDCDLLYQFSRSHRPGVELGLRWNDPALAIAWPLTPQVISERDLSLPLLAESTFA
jgi:dTDP-4-dehydrorhamnose 3,5-epimerase